MNMTKKILGVLVVLILSMGILVACGDSKEPTSGKEVNGTTTVEKEVTTKKNEVETTTEKQEETTEEETTSTIRTDIHEGGLCFGFYSEEKHTFLVGRTIKNGDEISLNEYCESDDSVFRRGSMALLLYEFFELDNSYLIEKFGDGSLDVTIEENDNFVFEYSGNKTYMIEDAGYKFGDDNKKIYLINIYEVK